MLKYDIKLTNKDLDKEVMVWGEKYLSPDLSFVSGVTAQAYHLFGKDTIEANNRMFSSLDGYLDMETENTTRTGFVVAKNYKYPVFSAETYDYSISESAKTEYYYTIINGKYYYAYDDGSGITFHIDTLVNENDEVMEAVVDAEYASGCVSLDRIFWIEGNIVSIDGHDYFYDRNIGDNGCICYDFGSPLSASQITDCDDIEYHPFKNSSDFLDITKFTLRKTDDFIRRVENIGFVKYFFYVSYKDVTCPIRIDKTINPETGKESFEFFCEVPKYALSANTYGDNFEEYETVDYPVMFFVENDGEREASPATSENLEGYGIFDIEDLYKITTFVDIEDNRFFVDSDVINTNSGDMIRVELLDPAYSIGVGTRVYFDSDAINSKELKVETDLSGYSFNPNDTRFVVYRNEKYKIKPNLCDLVLIAETEYEIDYINGKEVGEDCLVRIGDENVPMKIVEGENGISLERYGYIVISGIDSATTATYEINTYDGVEINEKKYPVITGETDDIQTVTIDHYNRQCFIVVDVRGGSMLLCRPLLNRTDFTDEFYHYYSRVACEDVVENKDILRIFTKNTIFGENEITQELAFQMLSRPESSNDYYNLFEYLDLYCDGTYYNLSIPLVYNSGGNPLQDNLIDRDFFARKTEELINPLVDMEKDVYMPKYITSDDGKYSGSTTEFKPIDEIRINLHFRTRNEETWKINDGFNLEDTSGKTDNWFVTDFYPYKDMPLSSGSVLQETSDIMGLLYFTNDDIFYQKQKVGKSFVRLSFYDNTDSNTQSLLCNSCVFFDYHSMFKTFMDNSQKNINFYCVVDEESNDITPNKISVKTEVLTGRTGNFSGSPTIDETKRISSRLTIKNKYNTQTSSEGFYLYIFREYSQNLRPKPIYMKVDFNHAGIGRTIPFVIPMKWRETDEYTANPVSALSLSNSGDRDEMKKGIQLSYVNQQLYIPLYAVYDFKNKEYVYVFDDRYVQVENGIANINLFELKVMDETNSDDVDTKRDEIMLQKQITPIINMNDRQFEIMEPECRD